ncbi:MAG: FkbM family methyltransferase [Pseudomonadota bacterium]
MTTVAVSPAPAMQDEGAPPMGAFALPAPAEMARRVAGWLGTSRVARHCVSVLRRVALMGRTDPVDAAIFEAGAAPAVWARLHPRDNLSEKRAFAGLQFWDPAERLALLAAIEAHDGPEPFCFVDAGANVGLYSLAAIAGASRYGKRLVVVAIEPDPETAARLRFNLASAASATAQTTIIEAALSDTAGELTLSAAGLNRGEVCVAAAGTGRRVPALPLLAAVRRAGLAKIDALKIDIEGMEACVLAAFLAEAPETMHPALVLMEAPLRKREKAAGGGVETDALALLDAAGYRLACRTRLNAILTRAPDPISQPGHNDDTTGAARTGRQSAGTGSAQAGADLGG